jgi:hypothetical protein
MKIAGFLLPLSLILLAAPVLAQVPHAPGKGNPNGMSRQDSLKQGKKIHKPNNLQNAQQKREHNAKEEASAAVLVYASRLAAKEAIDRKQNFDRPSRPERPQIERPPRPGRP